jgi:hypothetical protein
MEYLNNISNRSLVKFPIVNKNKFTNEIEYLDYLQTLYTSMDAHLGIEYTPKFSDVPYSKINSHGYCYIYLPTKHDSSKKVDNEEYIKEYGRILRKAKKEGCRKFVITSYGEILNNDFWFVIQPFSSGSISFKCYSSVNDSIDDNYFVETYGKNFRSRYFPKINLTNNAFSSIPNKIKLEYDELVIFVPEKSKYLNVFLQKTKNVKFYIDKKIKTDVRPLYNAYVGFINDKSNEKLLFLIRVNTKPDLPIPEPFYLDQR